MAAGPGRNARNLASVGLRPSVPFDIQPFHFEDHRTNACAADALGRKQRHPVWYGGVSETKYPHDYGDTTGVITDGLNFLLFTCIPPAMPENRKLLNYCLYQLGAPV